MSEPALALPAGEAEVVFHGVSFDPKLRTTRVFGRDDLDRELSDPEVFSWIDLQGPSISALNEVLRRWGTISLEEAVESVLFLATGARYTTGEVLRVDGGRAMA